MTISRSELIKTRIQLLKNMHQAVIDMGDEDLYYWWVRDAVPDCPDNDIYRFIANHDEQWLECCDVFHKIYEANKENE